MGTYSYELVSDFTGELETHLTDKFDMVQAEICDYQGSKYNELEIIEICEIYLLLFKL